MPQASARRSFHGPLLATATARTYEPMRRPSLELVPAPPSASSLGRAILAAAREEAPSSEARERVLAGVLSALKCLTGSR